ncbi:type-2 histone deacetylase 1-like [Senna tora]|uniref:Type-2 histone deacetylase 1-like n=1 Tax=Senna tora TaxID=362788 RepID=A0A834TGD0_9FABA|nr:type-2 histone deacetylase 1-like [Senna tora]
MSSSGDEEYDSVGGSFVNPHDSQIGSFTSQSQSQLVSHHQPYAFDVCPAYLQPSNSNFLNLEAAPPRSDHHSTLLPTASASGGGGRNPKKRSRASRRAPTTVLTTDTSNFRAMVQEFTGIPPPPFSSSYSYSRRLASFRSSFPLLRPSPHKLSSTNPSLLLSSSPNSPSPLLMLPNHNHSISMGDPNLIASTTAPPNSILNYQLIPNTTLNHIHPLPFQQAPNVSLIHPFPNSLPPAPSASPFNPHSHSLSNIPLLHQDHLGLGITHTDSPTPQHHHNIIGEATCKLINFSGASSSTFNLHHDDNTTPATATPQADANPQSSSYLEPKKSTDLLMNR